MEAKLFEVRDRGTFVPVLAVRLAHRSEAERYLLGRAGFGDAVTCVVVARIDGGGGEVQCDPLEWTGARTITVAHRHIANHWHHLHSGDVVDVEHILGERDRPKEAERLTEGTA